MSVKSRTFNKQAMVKGYMRPSPAGVSSNKQQMNAVHEALLQKLKSEER